MAGFISIFDASFERATCHELAGEDFFAAFYRAFVAADPRVADAFAATDMDKQRSVLKKSFHYMVNFYATTELNDYLERIAYSHGPSGYAIEPALYDLWLETLIGVLRAYDPACSDEVEMAWRVVLSPGIAYMKCVYMQQDSGGGDLSR